MITFVFLKKSHFQGSVSSYSDPVEPPLKKYLSTSVTHGGFFKALTGAPKGLIFGKLFFIISEPFDVDKMGALGPRLEAQGPKLGPLRSRPVHWCFFEKKVILTMVFLGK